MKRCKSLVALFLALTASGAKAQFTETFSEPKLGPAWSFIVPGNNIGYQINGNTPNNTEDPSQYVISDGAFTSTQQGKNIYYGPNIPSVTVAPNASGDYDIRVTLNYSATSSQYPTAGLVIFKDTGNLLEFNIKNNAGNGEFASITLQVGGSQVGVGDNLANYANLTGPTVLRINKTGTTISFSYTPQGGTETALGTATAADTDPFKAGAYAFLKDVSNLHIGLTNDNYDGSATATAAFSNFSTSLPVVTPKITDNFRGPKLNPTWVFPFPGSWSDTGYKNSSEDPGAYSVGSGVFNIKASNSGLYGLTSYIRNVASATIAPTAAGDYDIEVAVDSAFSNPTAVNAYPFYGLLVYTDAGNYFFIGPKTQRLRGGRRESWQLRLRQYWPANQ